MEEALAVPFVRRPRQYLEGGIEPPPELIQALRRLGPRCLAATDGGSEAQRLRYAGWGVVLANGATKEVEYRCHGMTPGADHTSWSAEMCALEVLCRAAAEAEVDLDVLIDNQTVQGGLNALIARRLPVPNGGFGRWRDLERLVQGRQHTAHWVPSHGKVPAWRPVVTHLGTAQEWRRLNDVADFEATQGLRASMRFYEDASQERRAVVAASRAQRHLDRVYAGSVGFLSSGTGSFKQAWAYAHAVRRTEPG